MKPTRCCIRLCRYVNGKIEVLPPHFESWEDATDFASFLYRRGEGVYSPDFFACKNVKKHLEMLHHTTLQCESW